VSGAHGDLRSASCIYEGKVRHWRLSPEREFGHRISMAYVDLDELPSLVGGRLLRPRPGLTRFRRRDYHGDPRVPLETAVRDTVTRYLGCRPEGPIRVLTSLRSYGLCFNPVSFYYCFDDAGARVEAVLAEVTNTPWGERHAYVIQGEVGNFDKALHVSPFMGMDHVYRCRATAPGSGLQVVIENHRRDEKVFEASLAMSRREMSPAALRRISVRYPMATVRTLVLIYGHALGLRLAGVRPFPHPPRRPA
jgi:uncharacterized protein